MIIYVLMGRALYCPQGSKPRQNLCPMPLKYHVFISLALRQWSWIRKEPGSVPVLCWEEPQMWFSFETRDKWQHMREKAWSCKAGGGILEGSAVTGGLCWFYLGLPVNLFFPKVAAPWSCCRGCPGQRSPPGASRSPLLQGALGWFFSAREWQK